MNAPFKGSKLATGLKWGLGLGAAVLVAPVVFLAVKGIVGLAAAAVVGLVLINGAPVLAMTLANWKLKGIKYAATSNPVETLQNAYREQDAALDRFRQSITDFRAEVANFSTQVDGFAAQFPQDASKFSAQLEAMNRLLKVRESRYQTARGELQKFAGEIKRAEAIWKMGQAAQRLNKAAGFSDDDFLARIKTETALDSVQSSMNKAFAELETSLMDETPHPVDLPTLDVSRPDMLGMDMSRVVSAAQQATRNSVQVVR